MPALDDTALSLALASATLLALSLLALLLLLLLRSKSANGKVGVKGRSVKVHATSAAPKPRVHLLFGTQTGTAERFAKSLRGQLGQRYGDTTEFEVLDVEEYDPAERLPNEQLVLLLLATYGDGEPTDNANGFFNWLTREADNADAVGSGDLLKGVRYAVFGLGNKQYEHFCAVGKRVNKAMASLGATAVVRRGDGDDDEDIEADFETWVGELMAALDTSGLVTKQEVVKEQLTASDIGAYDVRILPAGTREADLSYANGSGNSANSLFDARVAVVRELHTEASDRSCLHVELDVSGSAIRYVAGDHVAVYPHNGDAAVARAAAVLGVDLDSVLELALPPGNPGQLAPPFPSPVTVHTALSRYADLVGPLHRDQLVALAPFASDSAQAARLRALASPEGKEAFKEYTAGGRGLVDMLEEFSSARPPLGVFFASLAQRLQPRFYSISSSPLLHPNTLHVTCAVVREPTAMGRDHEGVASTFLARCQPGDRVPLYVRTSSFRLPSDATTPLVMVGPGTGLAPFRGFLQERQVLQQKGISLGPAHLYFGCRKAAHDYIYQEELEAWLACGVLSSLHLAFSRDGPAGGKDYVQHHMLRHGPALWAALAPAAGAGGARPGYFYVCGDAKRMARDVHRALHEVAADAGVGKSGAEAAVKALADDGRYHKDVW